MSEPPESHRSTAREIACLTNVYPSASHTFIRREIIALEEAGWRVHRFAHRRSRAALVDRADREEEARTSVLLETGPIALLGAVLRCVATRPMRTLRAILAAIRMSRASDRGLFRHLGYFVLACELSSRLRRLGLPHLHVHFGTNPADVARLCRGICGGSYSVTFHGPHEFVTPDRLNLASKVAEASFIVVVSEEGRDRFAAMHPRAVDKALLVRCGLDSTWRTAASTPVPPSDRLLCVARLDEQKNPALLVEAARRLAARGAAFRLTIAGDGSLRESLKRRIADAGLRDRVVLAGWRTQPQIIDHLRESRALVLSSAAEGLPVSIMEAFALGRPAIATDVGAVRELVETGATGWLVRAGDPEALADAMRACLEAPIDALQRMAEEARRRVSPYDVRESARLLGAAFERSRRERA